MADALSRHDDEARAIVASFGGQIVKHTGDGWHAVFDDPLQALRAAHDYQRALPAIGAAAGIRLAVRCGIHTGVAQTRDGDYFGPVINRAARVADAAHGGQVLATQAVADLTQDRLPPPLALRDLGRVRLRGVIGAIGVYQLDDAAAPREFPSLRGLESTPNNLPMVATSFVGRAGAMVDLTQTLSLHRLVTSPAPAGSARRESRCSSAQRRCRDSRTASGSCSSRRSTRTPRSRVRSRKLSEFAKKRTGRSTRPSHRFSPSGRCS
jgi:hypothetical protein